MENMIAHSHELKGKMKENVEAFVDQAHISKMLATIILDVPIEVSDDDLLISEPDREKLAALFTELEFRSMGRRILGANFSVNQQIAPEVKKSIPAAPKPSNGQISMFGDENALEEDHPEPTENRTRTRQPTKTTNQTSQPGFPRHYAEKFRVSG
jgi:DNA polymerase-1